MKVFISYAREDIETARKLYHDLKQAGISPWMDKEDLLPGQNWRVMISKAIQESKYFLAVLSSHSLTKRGFVQKELKMALDILDEFPEDDIFIIPIRIEDCKPEDEKLKYLHWADFFPSYQEGLSQILRVLMHNNEPATPVFGSEKNKKSNIQDEQPQYVPSKIENIASVADISKKEKPSPTRNLAMKTYRVILIVGTILLVNIVYMTTQPHIRNKLIEIFQGRILVQREKPLIKYQLRKTPMTVSHGEVQSKFKLNDKWRPLEYIENDFQDNGNGTITDNATWLMWQKSGSDNSLTYEDAKVYIEELNRTKFAGYNDWRLPTVDELKSLMTPKKMNGDLYIYPIFDKIQSWCWTSDKNASDRGAWGIVFIGGVVSWADGAVYIRAVRSIQ